MKFATLTDRELVLAQNEVDKRKKSSVVAWLLWLGLRGIGGHRYYLGPTWQAVLMTLTLGGLGIWTIIDAFFIGRRLRHLREQLEADIVQELLAARAAAAPAQA